jgi:cell fate (sporulation/competence/biofilm development) regulator YlbF (YheA/YmcA/DUF963 family)
MFELLDEIVELIYSDEKYQRFIEKNNNLDNIQELLNEYADSYEEYIKQKKYSKYIDISSSKDKYINIKKQLNETKEIQEYYKAYHELNDLLDDITKVIFNGITDLEIERYTL